MINSLRNAIVKLLSFLFAAPKPQQKLSREALLGIRIAAYGFARAAQAMEEPKEDDMMPFAIIK